MNSYGFACCSRESPVAASEAACAHKGLPHHEHNWLHSPQLGVLPQRASPKASEANCAHKGLLHHKHNWLCSPQRESFSKGLPLRQVKPIVLVKGTPLRAQASNAAQWISAGNSTPVYVHKLKKCHQKLANRAIISSGVPFVYQEILKLGQL